ncbi:hypothetical protein ASPZODRAFT_162149 [Penicilliopsis zonata CBS 506.65]|uniref:Serine hydrolase domain-containing protein n=1 Tax=Penicilliopsis zonata CBS 506.65 TaxID=1073090 RepID=A0A1L9S5T9_9EURO|nr:hypothetical protein ASPZODRAFT_162149 [Penicilliopsis zonata CBS 506.65]OJJ42519.1 hypothetical protein ASPZODRAFT_162149 [Penicilliopsis zonata CBS 506.65]
MPLRFLCLHGWGTSEKILRAQLQPLMAELERDHTASFHFVEGEIESDPGPGIAGVYEGPYWSYHPFPLRGGDQEPHDQTVLAEAYAMLDETIAREGPFDGLLGFSHGGVLAAGYLLRQARGGGGLPWGGDLPRGPLPRGPLPLPVRCAVFVNSLPPFRMAPGQRPAIERDLLAPGHPLALPTVSIVGAQDALRPYSLALHALCEPASAGLVVHSRGHEIPGDRKNVVRMAAAIRKMAVDVSLFPNHC